MKNPWFKKNPLLSMWLSGAHTMAGVARRKMVVESRRRAAEMMTRGTKQVFDFWSGAMTDVRPRTKKKKRR